MLPLEECRKFLPKDSYTDDEVEKIRDCLYQIAGIAIDDYFSKSHLIEERSQAKA